MSQLTSRNPKEASSYIYFEFEVAYLTFLLEKWLDVSDRHTPRKQSMKESLSLCFLGSTLALSTRLRSAPSCSWTGLKGYYFRPVYYLTSLSPADPAPPLFLWGASLPLTLLPVLPFSLPPSCNQPGAPSMRSSAKDPGAHDLKPGGDPARSSAQDLHTARQGPVVPHQTEMCGLVAQ